MTDQADMETLTRARELGILDRVLPDAENAIYDAGKAAGVADAAKLEALVDRIYWMTTSRASPKKRAVHIRWMIEKYRGEAKGHQ